MHETYCVSINDSLSDVASLIVRKNTQRAFVLDENRELCGVVSTGDVLKITMQKYRQAFSCIYTFTLCVGNLKNKSINASESPNCLFSAFSESLVHRLA